PRFSPTEAFAWHEELLARRSHEYDPRVASRIEMGRTISAAAYIRACAARIDFIGRIATRTAEFDALLMPTVPIVAPPIVAFADDEYYSRIGALITRNTGLINFLDRCALSLPIQPAGSLPVGLMVVGEHGADQRLLAISRGIETKIGGSG